MVGADLGLSTALPPNRTRTRNILGRRRAGTRTRARYLHFLLTRARRWRTVFPRTLNRIVTRPRHAFERLKPAGRITLPRTVNLNGGRRSLGGPTKIVIPGSPRARDGLEVVKARSPPRPTPFRFLATSL